MYTISKHHFKLIYFFSVLVFISLSFQCTNEESGNQTPPEKVVPVTPKAEYTDEEAGEWEEIKSNHLPKIKIDNKSKKDNIEIHVEGIFSEQHYIERIGIMDENKQDLAGKSLKKNEKPEVTLSLDPIPENPKVKVYVKCNLHDLWTRPLVVPKKN